MRVHFCLYALQTHCCNWVFLQVWALLCLKGWILWKLKSVFFFLSLLLYEGHIKTVFRMFFFYLFFYTIISLFSFLFFFYYFSQTLTFNFQMLKSSGFWDLHPKPLRPPRWDRTRSCYYRRLHCQAHLWYLS